MENASKALIIAGAILLSILLISLGLIVYNNAKQGAEEGNLDQQQITTFNAQWLAYRGDHVTGAKVKDLYEAIVAHNAAEERKGTQRYIDFSRNSTLNETQVHATATTNPNTGAGLQTAPPVNNATDYIVHIQKNAAGLVSNIGYNAR